jgi:hypothetical protein
MPGLLGQLRFQLARALWDDKNSRARSLELARQALADWAKLPARSKELAEVDEWIAAHAKGRRQ